MSFMKKILKKVAILAISTLVSSFVFGQENEAPIHSLPKWISGKGYWIIESNIKTPDTSIIHFYNNNNIEVYSEKLQGITLNLKKRKTLMRLKKALETSLLASEQWHLSKDNVQLVATMLKL